MSETEWRIARAIDGLDHPAYREAHDEYDAELQMRLLSKRGYRVWAEKREVGEWSEGVPRKPS